MVPAVPPSTHKAFGKVVVPSLDMSKLKSAKPSGRPPFQVELIRQGPQWRHFGFTVGLDSDPSFLTVDALWSPSLVSRWNKNCSPRQRVRTGDMIVSANGKTGSNEALLAEIQSIGQGARLRLEIVDRHSQNPQEGPQA